MCNPHMLRGATFAAFLSIGQSSLNLSTMYGTACFLGPRVWKPQSCHVDL